MKSAVIRRSIHIHGRKTSVSLENEFWNGLREIAQFKNTSVSALVDRINEERDNVNLSSAIRIFVYEHFQSRREQQENENIIEASDQLAPRDN